MENDCIHKMTSLSEEKKVDVNQLFEMINTCIRNFKILIK